MNMEQRRNDGPGVTGDARENPPTSVIVRHDFQLRKKAGSDLARDQTRIALARGERSSDYAIAPPCKKCCNKSVKHLAKTFENEGLLQRLCLLSLLFNLKLR